MRIELYGVLSEVADTSAFDVAVPVDATVADVLATVGAERPELTPHLERVAVAIGDRLVHSTDSVGNASELVLLPPVSGG